MNLKNQKQKRLPRPRCPSPPWRARVAEQVDQECPRRNRAPFESGMPRSGKKSDVRQI